MNLRNLHYWYPVKYKCLNSARLAFLHQTKKTTIKWSHLRIFYLLFEGLHIHFAIIFCNNYYGRNRSMAKKTTNFIKEAGNGFQHSPVLILPVPLFISWCYINGIKQIPNPWWINCGHFLHIIGYHTNSITSQKNPIFEL